MHVESCSKHTRSYLAGLYNYTSVRSCFRFASCNSGWLSRTSLASISSSDRHCQLWTDRPIRAISTAPTPTMLAPSFPAGVCYAPQDQALYPTTHMSLIYLRLFLRMAILPRFNSKGAVRLDLHIPLSKPKRARSWQDTSLGRDHRAEVRGFTLHRASILPKQRLELCRNHRPLRPIGQLVLRSRSGRLAFGYSPTAVNPAHCPMRMSKSLRPLANE